MNNNTLKQIQIRNINKSLKIFKEEVESFRRRDLEQFEGTDYLQDLSKEELEWYMSNCEDFLYSDNTIDAKRRDVYAHNPVSDEIIMDNYIAETENEIIRLLKFYGDKRLVLKHLKEELLDELQAYPQEEAELQSQFDSKASFLKRCR